MNKKHYNIIDYTVVDYRGQSGMTLVVSLVILMAMTLLGVTSMQSTRTEISMAGNLRESGLTFNATEVGLRAGEDFVDSSGSNLEFDNPGIGLYPELANDPPYGVSATWDAAQTADTTLPYVIEQPRFIIHFLGERSQNEVGAVNIGGYGSGQPGITVANFRITARGTGQSGNAHRYVQSYYGKQY